MLTNPEIPTCVYLIRNRFKFRSQVSKGCHIFLPIYNSLPTTADRARIMYVTPYFYEQEKLQVSRRREYIIE